MNKYYFFILFASLLLNISSAFAQICTTLEWEGKKIIVRKEGTANQFYPLMKEKLFEEAVTCCVSCLVKPGTKVIITDRGLATHSIRVLEGINKGCSGELDKEFLTDCKF